MDKMLRRGLVLVTLFVGCILTGGVEAAIREVGHSGYPYTSIQSAINAAANGDTVLVHWGTYVENINFLGKAITVKSDYGPRNTTIDGNSSGRGVTFNSGEGQNSVLDGFTIMNGLASAAAGGGIACWYASPTISNCIIIGNTASYNGGGISCYGEASPTITNCTISGNTSGWGGGISCGYSSNPTITNCIIRDNHGYVGGGISCDTTCFPTITNCTISANTADSGGGIYCYSSSSPTVINCTISRNGANYGAGIYCDSTSSSSVKNTILWGNFSDQIYLVEGSSISVTYSDVDQDGYAGNNGNIRQAPLFVDPLNNDFKLQPTSACIDAGTSDGAPTTDMISNPRIDVSHMPNAGGGMHSYYDMGALEYVYSDWDSVNPSVSSNWQLNGIHFPLATEGWAVGVDYQTATGVLLHYSKGTWTAVTPPFISSNWQPISVHFTSASNGWAVGEDSANHRGVLLHYSGRKWTSVPPPSVSTNWGLWAVHFTSAAEGWAVGTDGQNRKGVLLHYSKGKWTSVAPPSVSGGWALYAVHFTSAAEGWAVGGDDQNHKGVFLHYSAGTWTSVPPPPVSSNWEISAVHFTSAAEGWAVGESYDGANTTGVLFHYSGGTWTSVTPPSVSSGWALYAVHFTSATEGWAVGEDSENGPGVLLHYSEGEWTLATPPSVSPSWYLDGVHFTSAAEGWAVGGDWSTGMVLLHYSMWPETFSSKLNIRGFAQDSNLTDGECHVFPGGTFYMYEDDHGTPRYYTGTYSTAPNGRTILFSLDSNGLSAMQAMLADRMTNMGVKKGVSAQNISFVLKPMSSFRGSIQNKTNAPSVLTIRLSGTVSALFNGVNKTTSFTYQSNLKYHSP